MHDIMYSAARSDQTLEVKAAHTYISMISIAFFGSPKDIAWRDGG